MPEPEAPRRLLLIQLRRVGDVVVSTALLEDLHRAYPGVECDWLVSDSAPILQQHPLIDVIHAHDHRDLVGMCRTAMAGRYDWVIDVQGSWRTAVVTAASRADVRCGWRGWNRGWAYTHAVRRAPRGSRVYVVTDRRRLLAPLGVRENAGEPHLYLSEHERSRGLRRIRKHAPTRPVAGLVLATSDPDKDWPAERFAAVAAALESECVSCLAFATPGSLAQAEAYRAALGDGARVQAVDQLRSLMELIAACDVFISADTGPAHIASALGVPRVTVYGPTEPGGWTPASGQAIAVRAATHCAACAGRARAGAHTCLAAVTPDMVLTAVRSLLAGGARTAGRPPAGNQ